MADFTYMGSKKLLAPRIADLVAGMANGPFLDLFSGIATVGSQIGTRRQIWSNDVQQFSALLTTQRFCARNAFSSAADLIDSTTCLYAANRSALNEVWSDVLQKESAALASADTDALRGMVVTMALVGREKRQDLRNRGLHCLFATTHSGTYFGLRQSIDIDSLRYAADGLLASSKIGDEQHRWMVLALCQVISTINNSTGHFAQYLSPSEANVHRVIRKRKMDVWQLWTQTLMRISPLGTVAWRRSNRVFNADALTLLALMAGRKRQPVVIYADPPYTSDQYSRFYHVLENAVLYDYPETSCKGQYRLNRFTSGFSLKSAVHRSFDDLIAAAAQTKAVFVLSYPTNGLLKGSTNCVLGLLSRHFAHVENPIVVPHLHSTLGGSKGPQKHEVEENIFVAYQLPAARYRSGATVGRTAVRERPQTQRPSPENGSDLSFGA